MAALNICITVLGICIVTLTTLATMYRNEMKEETSRKDYIDELRNPHPKIGKTYITYLRKVLNKLKDWFGAPCSVKALTLNTSLAIFYTIFFFVISWVIGRSGKIGDMYVLADSLQIISRISFILLFALILWIMSKHRKIDSKIQSLLAKKIPPKAAFFVYRIFAVAFFAGIAQFLGKEFLFFLVTVLYSPAAAVAGALVFAIAGIYAVAGTFAITIVGAFIFIAAFAIAFGAAGEVAGAGAYAVAVAITGAVTYAVAGVGAYAVAGAGAFAGAFAGVATGAFTKKTFLWLYFYCILMVLLLFIGLFFEIIFLELSSRFISYLLFIVILPFINGFVDFVSLGVSRFLGQEILKNQTFKACLGHLIFDFAVAIILLGLLVFGICFGVELFNNLIVKNPDLMIDLSKLITDAKKAPWGPGGLWITLVLFSTLVPTFAHFVIAFIGTFTVYLTPRKLRQKIADTIEKNRNLMWPSFYFASRPLFGILFAAGFWGGLVYIINKHIPLGDILSTVAYWGITLACNIST